MDMDASYETEALRQKLLDEIWVGGCAGLGAMLLDEEEIRSAGPEQLRALARQYGIQ